MRIASLQGGSKYLAKMSEDEGHSTPRGPQGVSTTWVNRHHIRAPCAMVCSGVGNCALQEPVRPNRRSSPRPPPWATRKTLTAKFETWLDQQDFSQACLDEEQQKLKRIESTQRKFESFLINGLTAVNHILKSADCQPLTLNNLKQVAAKMAQAEASMIVSSFLAQLNAQQLDDILSADVILKVLNDHENILVTKWDDNSLIPTDRLLVASDKHWTALLKDKQD